MTKRQILTSIIALSLLIGLVSPAIWLSPAGAESQNFQVKVVKTDFSSLQGVPVEVWQGTTPVATQFTNSAGDVFFSLPVGVPYEFRAGNASTTASAVDVPAATLVGVILMPTNHYLRVKTDPVDLVTIPGQGWHDECTTMTLTAPMTVTKDYALYVFDYWDVDGISQTMGDNEIDVHMDASHTATAYYTKLVSISKVLISSSHDPIPTNTQVSFTMRVTLHTYETVTGVTVKDSIGADLVLVSPPPGNGVEVTYPGKGKMGATIVTWTIGDANVCQDYTLDILVRTGLNPRGKQEYTSPGEKKLNSGPVVYFTYNGTLYQLRGPSLKVTATAP